MDHRESFVSEILEHPEDDTPRLIYADWLEERGDPRAELIRVQCALSNLPPNDAKDRPRLLREERRLLFEHGEHFKRDLRERLGVVGDELSDSFKQFDRGFMECLRVNNEAEVSRLKNFVQLQPLNTLELFVPLATLFAAVEPEWLARFRGLTLGGSVDRHSWHRMLYSDLFPALRELSLSRTLTPGELESLCGSDCARQLTRFDLNFARLGDDGLERLCANGGLESIKRLNLTRCDIGEAGLKSLCDGPMSQLNSLDLSNNHLLPESMKYFASAHQELRELKLYSCGITSEHCEQLVSEADIFGIETLILTRNYQLDARAIAVLANSEMMSSLLRLSLNGTGIGHEGLAALAASPLCDQLTQLDLSSSSVDNRALPSIKKFSAMQHIALSANQLTGKSLSKFFERAEMPNLSTLELRDLQYDQHFENALSTLAQSDRFPFLSRIRVRSRRSHKRGVYLLQKRYGEFAVV